jgi:hypothetical protein
MRPLQNGTSLRPALSLPILLQAVLLEKGMQCQSE